MTEVEFRDAVSRDPMLAGPLRDAAAAARAQQYVIGVDDATLLVFIYPIARVILTQIGLPWLGEGARYADLWRLKFHKWVDEQYRHHGLDPDQAEAAGDALRQELEQTTDATARAAWEQLAKKLTDPSNTMAQ